MPRRPANARARGPYGAAGLRKPMHCVPGSGFSPAATELFLAEGYGSTSIEAVAVPPRISKRTLYDRFEDKAALFAAAVHEVIAHIRPPPEVPLIEGAALPDMLHRLAQFIYAALAPPALALYRLVHAEAARFPQLARAVEGDAGNREAVIQRAQLGEADLPEVVDPLVGEQAVINGGEIDLVGEVPAGAFESDKEVVIEHAASVPPLCWPSHRPPHPI